MEITEVKLILKEGLDKKLKAYATLTPIQIAEMRALVIMNRGLLHHDYISTHVSQKLSTEHASLISQIKDTITR